MVFQSTNVLQGILFFKGLSDMELNRIQPQLIPCSYKDKMNVFLEGETFLYVYFIVRGKVKICRMDEQGKEQIVNVLQVGDMFPHKGFFESKEYPANAVMIEKGLLYKMPIAAFQSLLLANPGFCMKLLAVMEAKITELHSRLREIVMYDVNEQIIYLLLRIANSHGEATGKQVRINVPFTNQEFASMIGTSRESVSRTLNHLKKIGVIRSTSKRHLLINVELLKIQLEKKIPL